MIIAGCKDIIINLQDRIRLIPRNNWDYGITAVTRSLVGINQRIRQAADIETIFHLQPIWTNSGRTSLYAILKSLDLPSGAAVGVPLFCCSVVFNAICQADLAPRFIDSNSSDCNLSVEDLRKKRADLAAVVPVHMFGNPCDMDTINEVAGEIPVIEDCAQSFLSTYKGKPAGTLSTASFFSFRCGKYISAGEGSAIFCKDIGLQKKVEGFVDSFESRSKVGMVANALSTFVKAALYNRPLYGLIGHPMGMRLDKKLNLTSKDGFEVGKIASTHLTLINSRIPGFYEKINLQREHAHMLHQSVKPVNFTLPSENQDCSSNWFQFALRFENMQQRDRMADYLFDQGIDTAKYLDTIADEARREYGYQGDCPNAEKLSKTILLVPIHYSLGVEDIIHLASSINEGARII